MADVVRFTPKERIKAVFEVAKLAYKTAPLAVFMQIFSTAFNAVLPFVTTYYAALTTTALAESVVNRGAGGERVIEYVVITALLGVLSMAWSIVQSYINQALQYKIEAAVTDRMHEHFLRLEFWRYDDKETIDTYDKASRFANLFPYLFARFADVIGQLIGMAAGIGGLFFVSPFLGLLIIVALIPSFVVQSRVSKHQAAHWKRNVEVRRKIDMINYGMFRPENMAELRLYDLARYLLGLRKNLRDRDDKVRIEFERRYVGKRIVAEAVTSAAEVVALIWIVIQIINLKQPIGQFVYVQQITSRALSTAASFISTINMIDEDLANLIEYQNFSNMPEATRGTATIKAFTDRIRIDDVSFRYRQGTEDVLKHITMDIAKGDHIAIVGENGAGKSTLIKLLSGLYEPTGGVITIDGVPLPTIKIDSWHGKLAVLQQDFINFKFATAKENILYGDTRRTFEAKRFEQAVDMAETRRFIEKLPKGFDNYISTWIEDDDGVEGTDLSGGQWQRMALARNFYRDSPVIILDEPTSAIDAVAEARIFKHIFEQKDKTVITISHRLSTVKKADVIYMIENGEIAEQGTYEELVAKKGEFFTMFESQM